MELAGLFHPFYEHCPVVTADDSEVAKARLLLIAGVRDAIREGLDLLGVAAPGTERPGRERPGWP